MIGWVIRKYFKRKSGRKIKLNCMSFGIGDISCELVCSNEVQEIAYQLWVELTTRKIAIPLEDSDVIAEVYDSWYAAFTSIRELLKTVPGRSLDDASKLIDVTTKVLNEGLRPHLTTWHAKFRAWYDDARKESKKDAPQETQKKYPEYEALVNDLRKTNENMINFANEMKKIAFSTDK